MPTPDPASEEDVIFDQLDYLLRFHGHDAGHFACTECGRLAAVKAILMHPFTEPMKSRATHP